MRFRLVTLLIAHCLAFATCQLSSAQDEKQEQPTEKSAWQLEQEWEQTRDVEKAMQILKQLRDDPSSNLDSAQRLLILQLQMRFGDLADAEETHNSITEHVLAYEGGQYPYPLTFRMSNHPQQYPMLESFIARPGLTIPQAKRDVGRDRIQMWRVNNFLQQKKFDKAIEAAESISVKPKQLSAGRRDYRTSDYLCTTSWQVIFRTAIGDDKGEQALEIFERFKHDSDRSTLLRYGKEEIRKLSSKTVREKLVAWLEKPKMNKQGDTVESWEARKKNFEALIKDQDYATIEFMVNDFDSEPGSHIARVILLLQAYHEGGKETELKNWLSRIATSAKKDRSRSTQLLQLFRFYNREVDALDYFGGVRCRSQQPYKEARIDKQPLAQLAIDLMKEGKLEEAIKVVEAIEEPVWRSGTLAKLSQIVVDQDPELSKQWWLESLRLIDTLEKGKLKTYRLKFNCELLAFEKQSDEALKLLKRFDDKTQAASLLATWMLGALDRGPMPAPLLRSAVDKIAELDPSQLENVVTRFREIDQFNDCVYAAMKMKEDTDIGYYSYALSEFGYFFKYAAEKISLEQTTALFDNQLPKHRGAVMAKCLENVEGKRHNQVLEEVLKRLDNSDVDLRLHHQLMKTFVEQGDLDRLRELLERDAPASQFLNDDPFANSWRIGRSRYTWMPAILANKIGGNAMLEFARSLNRPESRKIAYTQALYQLAEDDGLGEAERLCNEIEAPNERAATMLMIIDRYLTPQKPEKGN